MAERVLALPELRRARRVASCLSFGRELDTHRLIARLVAEGREVVVPRAEPRDRSLHFHRWPCALETLDFGLRQPRRGEPESAAEEIDLVLVLGLGFDRRGFRLGYGAGYFDRFLARRKLPAIGLAHDFQLVNELPAEPHDVPMTIVVTASEVVRRAA